MARVQKGRRRQIAAGAQRVRIIGCHGEAAGARIIALRQTGCDKGRQCQRRHKQGAAGASDEQAAQGNGPRARRFFDPVPCRRCEDGDGRQHGCDFGGVKRPLREVARKHDHRPVPDIERIGDEAHRDERWPCQHAARDSQIVRRVHMDQRGCAKAGQQRPKAGKGGRLIIEQDGGNNGDEPAERGQFTRQPAGQRRHGSYREQRPGHQFPKAARGRIERHVRRDGDCPSREGKRGCEERPHHAQKPRAAQAKQRPQHERKQQVILFLDPERPHVEQRDLLRHWRKIAHFQIEIDVRRKGQRGNHTLAKGVEIDGDEQDRAGDTCAEEKRQQIGHDPADPPFVELQDRKCPAVQFPVENARDQIARDHEEDIDPDKAA